jgi:hypothetical protein
MSIETSFELQYYQEIRNVWEMDLIRLESQILQKPDWHSKLNNSIIVNKWREEAHSNVFDYVIQKIQHYKISPSVIQSEPIPNVFQLEGLISSALKDSLLKQSSFLKELQDYHPGTTQVLDLIHPSLFPIEFNRSIAPINGKFTKIPKDSKLLIADDFQWLPTTFKVENGVPKAISYINNLHPKHKDLYNTIENILQKFIPFFQLEINKLASDLGNLLKEPSEGWLKCNDEFDWDQENADEKYDDFYNNREFNEPNLTFKPQTFTEKFNLGNSELQVIVKMANIHLKPGESYKGGNQSLK